MIVVKLKEAMQGYRRRTGRKMTYAILEEATGLAAQTLGSIASREGYNTTLATIDKLCRELEVTPAELLEYVPTKPARRKQTALRRKPQRKKKTKRP